MMWAQGSFGSIASTDQDKANCTASYDIAIPASYSPPHLEHLRSSRDVGDFAVAPNAHITVPTFPDNLALGQFQWQPLPRPMRLCRQQCCAEALAARNVLRRSLNAQRQRIRRLDEAYRTAERVRNAQRQRRLRANAEYRARELYRSRLRRMQKAYLVICQQGPTSRCALVSFGARKAHADVAHIDHDDAVSCRDAERWYINEDKIMMPYSVTHNLKCTPLLLDTYERGLN
ncbi:hypothetical protein HPB51_017796 [Rhipicephalus microplus]|uniref:Uncharacterized protein n=1 Tax=Rhipicephalus microplus TaxID=6941 RepID=A0A9J6DWI3_RHIMP|nr:hypothetical protein HPB51_017796 [Rhipicephalus microplus]